MAVDMDKMIMKTTKVFQPLDTTSNDAELPAWLSKAIAQERATQDIEAFLRAQLEIHDLSDLTPLKVSRFACVFSVRVNGENVVVKQFFKATADQTVRKLKSELDYIEALFGDGDCQANTCRMAWPSEGIVMLSFAPGPRLGDVLSELEGDERRDLLNHSGRWLARYTAPRRHEGSFSPNFWIKRLRKKNLDGITDPADLAHLKQLLHAMEAQAQTIKGCPIIHAATHNDFVGINAHYKDGIIYGVDIQGETWHPTAKDAARFLVWLQIHNRTQPQNRRSGICQNDWDAFLSSNVISASEQETTMPFLIGDQLYRRYISEYARPRKRKNATAAITAYLDEHLHQRPS